VRRREEIMDGVKDWDRKIKDWGRSLDLRFYVKL
jgi:hypothetical protein